MKNEGILFLSLIWCPLYHRNGTRGMKNGGIPFLSQIYKKHDDPSPPDSFGEMGEEIGAFVWIVLVFPLP